MSLRSSVLKTFKSILPPLSQTEQEALESGTVGWDGELMKGAPDWKKLFALPKPQLTPEEQAYLDGPVEKFCGMIDNWKISQAGDLPPEAWEFIKANRLMGLEIPKEYGGLGFSSQMHSAVVIKIASRSIAAAVTVMVPNSLGPGELINEYGTQAQKDYYLPRLAKGEEIPCFALTGPDAGSDAGAIPDYGIVTRNEKGELGIRMSWEKRYITLGPVATIIGMAFKLRDPENLLGKNRVDFGITVALVPRDTPGVEIGDRHAPMDLPFYNGPNKGKDVFIPIDNIIGGAAMAGHGWRMLMECLAVGRCLSLPALSTAGAKLSSHASGAYARVRKQFNSSIARFEGIEEPLARIAGLTYMMNAAREATLQMVDMGERPAIPSAILKYHLTENMRQIVNDAMDIHGGKAICNGPRNIFADLYKGIPVAITVEGANIMTRNLIIFGQGSVRAHPYVLKELEAVADPDEKKAFKKLTCTLMSHVGNTLKNVLKSPFYGITGGCPGRTPSCDPATRKYYRRINRLCAAFSLSTDLALATLGGGLKRRERISARLGDVFSNLYLATTTLWYFEQYGRQQEDLPLVHWSVTKALYEAEQALAAMIRNHPSRIAAFILCPLIFPIGKRLKKPCDKMDVAAADTIRNPGSVRDRLTNGIHKSTDLDTPLGRLDAAFEKCVEAEPIEKKIYKAIKSGQVEDDIPRNQQLEAAKKAGAITNEEFEVIALAEKLRRDVVMVDAFPQKKTA